MTVRVGGRELAIVYAAAVHSGRDGPAELMEFIRAIRDQTGEPPEIADPENWSLKDIGRINEDDFPLHPFG